MCNIAGYVGERQAAPILIEMLQKQEGFAGGFYSGIATIHEGRIYHAKLTGDVKTLLKNTNAATLPGNIGIIHSRSKSGGGDSWAHPFIGCRDGRECEAYVANGYAGRFSICDKEYNALAESLINDGWQLTSKIVAENKNYQTLSDGSTVHMSDVMCQLITKNIAEGAAADRAIADAFCTMPNEIVGLLLSLTETDKIFWGRINRPMMLSFTGHGAYLGTTALSFPKDRGEVITLPANSSGYVTKSSFSASPFKKAPATVGEISAKLWKSGVDAVRAALKEGSKTFKQIEKEVMLPLFTSGDCAPNALLGYEVLRSLKEAGEIEIETNMVEGAVKELSAPQFIINLKE